MSGLFLKGWRRFRRDERGAHSVFLAMALIPLVGFAGIAVDTARGYTLKNRLTSSLDAAGLAAGRVFFSAGATNDAIDFFRANIPADFMGATVPDPVVTKDDVAGTVTLTVTATMPTSFMRIFGIDDVQVSRKTVIQRENRGLELVMVLDNTGSMRHPPSSGGQKRIYSLRDAANQLIDILYGTNETVENLWVGLVPYVTQVNVGSAHNAWLNSSYDPNTFLPDTWDGCVLIREGLDESDTPPTSDATRFHAYNYDSGADNTWPPISPAPGGESGWAKKPNQNGQWTGPNVGCPHPILPLTAEKSTIKAAIDVMRPWRSGGTHGSVGMAWGWRAISPQWRGMWQGSPSQLPLDYGDPQMDKVVIILTDGFNQAFDHYTPGPEGWDYTAYSEPAFSDTSNYNSYGRLNWSSAQIVSMVDQSLARICENMKAEGIIVYSITFDGGSPSLFQNCATSIGHYIDVESGDDLTAAFTQIGEELADLRISQ